MFSNYGDRNFFEYGILVEPVTDTEFRMLVCEPYSDVDDLYQFACIYVDIADSWIDKKRIADYIGESNLDPVHLAIAAYEYYGAQEFGADYMNFDWMHMNKADILKELEAYGVTESEYVSFGDD